MSSGQQIVNVGGAGRLVTKLFTVLSDDNITKNSVLGNYHSMSMDRLYTGTSTARYNGVLTSNVKYNDHFLYPVDVENSAQQFHYLTGAEGMVPFVQREEYNFEGKGLSLGKFSGYTQEDPEHGLAGRGNPRSDRTGCSSFQSIVHAPTGSTSRFIAASEPCAKRLCVRRVIEYPRRAKI